MTTPDDTTPTTETTNRTTTTTDPTETTNRTTTTTDPTETTRTDQTPTDASPRTISGRTPITEEAGAPLVPPIQTPDDRQTETDPAGNWFDTTRRPTPPPTDDERDAPLVPDLRPTCPPRTDGGSE